MNGYYYRDEFATPSPTPSPRGPAYYASTPQRPATRAHFRHMSSGMNDYSSPRPAAFSPRYNSDGLYSTNAATANVSATRSSRKQSFSGTRPKRERRSSYSYYRASDSHGESDEDEYVEVNGVTYVIPARTRSKRHSRQDEGLYYSGYYDGHATDRHHYAQASSRRPANDYDNRYEFARYFEEQPRRSSGHTRRASQSTPQRPQTTRPASSHHKAPPPTTRKATEADAKKYRIPPGYSLKNWDPTEEPILLLGSVFDANSLGKWIYDWTVYTHGPSTPISEMAGDMWLLLIQLAGKIKRSKECVPRIRTLENREMIEDFIESGERLTDKLRKVLKTCESPMLKASKKKEQLGKNSGIEFVETLFGRERELEKSERFMQSVRLWNLRFDANCEDVLKQPSK
ncbi:vegetative cell wall protein gp1 [Diaporthe amygdali]|uniref:vegetative cell wall protein gp1 n=1 Tax=Phomopsis amygdali TaxID=1214568 RepID=UPI0022FE83C2|nr:vegetative cell wall protein gp1 [Diaporthe amygdali]KAJ0119606.1 vegetative cell wall protein gp1 [Diaporthe amygdali]